MTFSIPAYIKTFTRAPIRQRILRRWLQAVATRSTTPCDIVVVGDSITEYGGATLFANGYVRQLKANLLHAFPTPGVPISQPGVLASGSPGYLPIGWYYFQLMVPYPTDGPVFSSPPPLFNNTYILGTTGYGLAGRSSTFQSSTQTWTLTTNASAWDVFYTGLTAGTHRFSYSVDAATPVSVTTSGFGAISPGQRVRVTPAANPGQSHTLQLAGNTGTPIIEGVYVSNGDESSGIRLWEAGHSAATTASWLTGGYLPLQLLAYIQPALVVIALGINDYNFGPTRFTSPAAMTIALREMVQVIRNYSAVPPSIVLLIEHHIEPLSPPFGYLETWDTYVQALYQFALDDGDIYVVDMTERIGNPPALIPSLNDATSGHPNDVAHKLWADALTAALLP